MLCDPDWVAAHLDDPGVVIVDMRWDEAGTGRSRYESRHIPGAVYLDWATDLIDPDNPIAFMLAPPRRFARVMQRCGIGEESTVVAYTSDLGSGPHRLWWAFRAYGHDDVRILDGGLERWVAEGRPLSVGAEVPRAPSGTRWSPHQDGSSSTATAADVTAARHRPHGSVLDSRWPEQFRGEAVWFETGPVADPAGIARTPRGDLRAGRVPWATNLPSFDLYGPEGRMRPADELRALFASVGVPRSGQVIAYCGVGISASALVFALTLAGIQDARLYDASWEEWGRDLARPIARG
ncbi:MAG: sulfurtransferase [Actinobacteria bacterium]|nr:sulfurtransferase [Actinomycetota bacterium]